ncbi:MAG: hypothetical protein O7G85_15505, partial [Planctomycetota bacterium]|nr:hypothetical protein [Planctomycetota bacterium]
MISWKRTNLPVFIGLVCSLLLHAGLLLPMMISTTTSQAQAQDLESRFDPEDFKRPEVEPLVPPEEETPLGLDIDTPSTLTWVGYEEYEEHIAALAKMDQAAFTDDPAAPPTPQVLADPTPPQETQETESQKTPEPTPSPAIELDPTQLLAMQNLMDMLGRLMPKPVQDEQEKPEEQETPPEKPS